MIDTTTNENGAEYGDVIHVTYVFDTSSIRAIRFADLSFAAQTTNLAISPITIFELLSHLDEEEKVKNFKSTTFDYFKVNLRKCQIPRLLDDPWAEQANDVGAKNVVNPSRFEDSVVLPQLISKLESSQTLEDFYRRRVTFPNGDVGDIIGLPVRVRDLLNEEETKYRIHVTKLCQTMLDNFSFNDIQRFTPADFVRIVAHAVNGLARRYEETLNKTDQIDITGPVFSVYYPYFGYGAARAIEYLSNANGVISRLNIDPNDMEDSAICAHLRLTEKRILVTDDGGTRDALKDSLQNLHSVSETLNQPVVALTEVINTDEFKRRTIPEHH